MSARSTTTKSPKPKAAKASKPASRTATKSAVPAPPNAVSKSAVAKPPVVVVSADKPALASETKALVDGNELKKRELIDMVVDRSDVKKKYAKPVVEAMLEVLGEVIAENREMNLQPLGRVKYNRTNETEGARVVVAKFRQNKSKGAAKGEATSEAAEATEVAE